MQVRHDFGACSEAHAPVQVWRLPKSCFILYLYLYFHIFIIIKYHEMLGITSLLMLGIASQYIYVIVFSYHIDAGHSITIIVLSIYHNCHSFVNLCHNFHCLIYHIYNNSNCSLSIFLTFLQYL